MEQHYSTVFSNSQGITARVCPRGIIALSIGHSSLTLRATDFLRLAQVVRNAGLHLCRRREERPGEQQHLCTFCEENA
ncbi:MAG TPA: hypothetical protein VNN62_15875, partial [Methylomirabilota bacterium]|nr:hypothetical protein [Methylomirabilota bacterium]